MASWGRRAGVWFRRGGGAKVSGGNVVRKALAKATSRGKSDVANKAVSMFLHEVSKRIVAGPDRIISKPGYADVVVEVFGDACPYCGEPLVAGRLAVEHLDGINRARVGLHIPGNVVIACADCNRAKRNDDANVMRALAKSGWESFLSHDGERCNAGCRTCRYWADRIPDSGVRTVRLAESLARLRAFRSRFADLLGRVESAREVIREDVEILYRDCQAFAKERIDRMTTELLDELRRQPGPESPP